MDGKEFYRSLLSFAYVIIVVLLAALIYALVRFYLVKDKTSRSSDLQREVEAKRVIV